jgi:hypothetical protein
VEAHRQHGPGGRPTRGRTAADEGIGRAKGDSFKNPVTSEEHQAQIVLPDGFIWRKGECGVGTFEVVAADIQLNFSDTNWIF